MSNDDKLTEEYLRFRGFVDDPTDDFCLRLPLRISDADYPTFLCVPKNPSDPANGHEVTFTSYDGDRESLMIVSERGALVTALDLELLLRALKQT